MRRRNDQLKNEQAERGAVRIRTVNAVMTVLAIILSVMLLQTIDATLDLIDTSSLIQGAGVDDLERLIIRQEMLTTLLLGIILATVLSVTFLILWPMREYSARIRDYKLLKMRGAYELRYLAEAYNLIYEENQKHNDTLRYQAEHDHLTGLYNRGAFEKLREEHAGSDIALMLVDVDKFKDVNDIHGHDVGDRILQKVAGLLAGSFRASDYPCRIGGDEFAVIMTDMTPQLREVVLDKLTQVKAGLRDTRDGLPEVTLSVGVAFSSDCKPGQELFKLANAALYRVKERGRNGSAFYADGEGEAAPAPTA